MPFATHALLFNNWTQKAINGNANILANVLTLLIYYYDPLRLQCKAGAVTVSCILEVLRKTLFIPD